MTERSTYVDETQKENLQEVKDLLEKRIWYVGFESSGGKKRKIPVDFDGFLNAILGGAIPNLTTKFKGANTKDKSIEVIIDYLLSKDISSSHMPTVLKRKEAPNYHTTDYSFIDNSRRKEILKWILSFYYLDLRDNKRRSIVAIRSDDDIMIETLRDNFVVKGGKYHFELSKGKLAANIGESERSYFIPYSPSSSYFALLILFSALFEILSLEGKTPDIMDLDVEIILLKNSGGNKWNVIYHPTVNIGRLYKLFFEKDEDYAKDLNAKFWVFLSTLNPPRLANQNVNESYYSDLASFSYSLLIEGYLNVEKLSEILSEKISLEFRAKRENKAHRFGPVLFVDYVQHKMLGGDSMREEFESLRKQMRAIAFTIGQLSKKGDTQKSLLKRIIMDIKSEDLPPGFVSALLNYLPRLEREGIRVSLPSQISTLPMREFLIIKNEFISNLWNQYIGGGKE
ncbi:hypothetical protein AciM339_1516 [Aciduliprofundum sp. MAR08-339]|uniref:hypothetical protein n=1 Tax=Aciduliprofundum sp. (strain MAR08-339) TaxID=673860 RepID=UPI0002A4C426|nr:hypothetical protein AciM339_1516 [Aciduliprofundum sp. MAR08-339]